MHLQDTDESVSFLSIQSVSYTKGNHGEISAALSRMQPLVIYLAKAWCTGFHSVQVSPAKSSTHSSYRVGLCELWSKITAGKMGGPIYFSHEKKS